MSTFTFSSRMAFSNLFRHEVDRLGGYFEDDRNLGLFYPPPYCFQTVHNDRTFGAFFDPSPLRSCLKYAPLCKTSSSIVPLYNCGKKDITNQALNWLAMAIACSNFLNQVQGRNKVIYNSTYWQVMASTKTKRVYRPIPSSLCQEDIIPDARKGIKCRKYFFEKVRQIK